MVDEDDFNVVMRRADIQIPEERRRGAVAVYCDLMRATRRLHASLDAPERPSEAYLIETVCRLGKQRH